MRTGEEKRLDHNTMETQDQETSELPSWLADDLEEEREVPADKIEDGLPTWLTAVNDDGLPSWLVDAPQQQQTGNSEAMTPSSTTKPGEVVGIATATGEGPDEKMMSKNAAGGIERENASKPPSPPLDHLVAAIDEEIEATFGPGTMTDLDAGGAPRADLQAQYILFILLKTAYAVPLHNVSEIGQPLDTTPVPNVPAWVRGVANLRGEVISMVDLRAFLGLDEAGHGQASRMMVAQARQGEMTTGLIVDRILGIRALGKDQIHAPTAPVESSIAPYLQGACEDDGRMVVVLDLEKLLLSDEMRQFESM
jgi:purine-binding chemotaxis protein CheW